MGCSKVGFVDMKVESGDGVRCVHAERGTCGAVYCALALWMWQNLAGTRRGWRRPGGADGFSYHPISGEACFERIAKVNCEEREPAVEFKVGVMGTS